MLNKKEIEAARSAKWMVGGEWGAVQRVFGPAAEVALLRGAKFKLLASDGLTKLIPDAEHDWEIAMDALVDVSEWLGFADIESYREALNEEKEKIFRRAK